MITTGHITAKNLAASIALFEDISMQVHQYLDDVDPADLNGTDDAKISHLLNVAIKVGSINHALYGILDIRDNI